jgi:hypothetical protein
VDPFPEDVRLFLEGNIDCLEQLETLRILGGDPTREWSVADMAREAQTDAERMVGHLAALQARGLLTSERREGTVYCRYGVRTPDLEQKVSRLLESYRQRPVTMIRMVYEKSSNALRTFAEAFRLRKKEN